MTKDGKIKILALCDTPTSATGFAQVARNILRGLMKTGKYEIDIIGINYFGDYYDRAAHPYNIYPAMPQGYQDMFGRGRLVQALAGQESRVGLKPPWDIVFTIQDSFVLEGLGGNFPFAEQLRVSMEMWKRTLPPEAWYSWIGYFPVDSTLKENWVTRSIMLAEYPVFYCDWGKKQAIAYDRDDYYLGFNLQADSKNPEGKRKARMLIPAMNERSSIIHHGVDLKAFYPIPAKERREFRKQYFGDYVKDDTFLMVNISRNQPRKDLARTLLVYAQVRKQLPKAKLYLHCKNDDAGGSIHEMARNFALSPGEHYLLPEDFDAQNGFPIETVNRIYNAADLCLTTTLGEGWGFMLTEAMATRTPVIAPYVTSVIDIFGEIPGKTPNIGEIEESSILRGIPAAAGTTMSEWFCMGLVDNERIRPLTNVDDMVQKIIWANKNPEKVKRITDRAYEWVKTLSWDNIVKEWDALFMAAFTKLESQRAAAKRFDKTGRNDPCPCNSGKKFKHCHAIITLDDKFADWLKQPAK